MGTLHENQHTFIITSRSLLLRMRNVLDKRRREKENIHFMFNNLFFEYGSVYEIHGKVLQSWTSHI